MFTELLNLRREAPTPVAPAPTAPVPAPAPSPAPAPAPVAEKKKGKSKAGGVADTKRSKDAAPKPVKVKKDKKKEEVPEKGMKGRPPKGAAEKKKKKEKEGAPKADHTADPKPDAKKRDRTGVDAMSNANFRRLAVLAGVRRVQGKEELFHRCKVLTKSQISSIVKNCVMLMRASKKTTLTAPMVLFEAKRQGHTMYWAHGDESTKAKKKVVAAGEADA